MPQLKPQTEAQMAKAHALRSTTEWQRYDEKPDALSIAAARIDLRKILKPGTKVFTSLQGNASKSGMTRYLRLFAIVDGDLRNITAQAARAQGDRVFERWGEWAIKATGCGMDMGFHEVYGLSRNLYPKGFKTSKKAPARNGSPVGSWDNDGGYALRHEWI